MAKDKNCVDLKGEYEYKSKIVKINAAEISYSL